MTTSVTFMLADATEDNTIHVLQLQASKFAHAYENLILTHNCNVSTMSHTADGFFKGNVKAIKL